MSTLHLVIICFTIVVCVAMITSTIDKVVRKNDTDKNRND
jgi:hypothetical protein